MRAHRRKTLVDMTEITAAILAGGKSTRFGSNKALALVNGIPIIQHIRDQLFIMLKTVILITNSPDEYTFLGLPMYRDIFPGRGPLGGVHTALDAAYTPWIFVVPCDLPYFSYSIVDILIQNRSGTEAVCFTTDRILEPVPMLIRQNCKNKVSAFFRQDDHSLHSFLQCCLLKTIQVESYGNRITERMLYNCNTHDNYTKHVKNVHASRYI